LDDFGIPLKLSCTVIEVHGKDRLEGVTIAKVDRNRRPIKGTEEYVECDTLLLSVGLIPENELSTSLGIEMDPITGGPVVSENRETSQKGVFACGNVLHVHDLVDYVTLESQLAGEGAAKYIKDMEEERAFVVTKGMDGVRYVVPQKININTDKDVKIYFRVGQVYKNAKVFIENDEEIILSRRKPKFTPGEMEDITIKNDVLKQLPVNSELIVRLEV
jgi:pyruvate/2-oxoglutarate dehydrogenase complex dihydrolipoamide dehydrogenase (E3) component